MPGQGQFAAAAKYFAQQLLGGYNGFMQIHLPVHQPAGNQKFLYRINPFSSTVMLSSFTLSILMILSELITPSDTPVKKLSRLR
jgi:hypothetical protein